MSASFAVTAEDIICTVTPCRNGSGPLWCSGTPTIVRHGDTVFASVPETSSDIAPLCNTRWQLFSREDDASWVRLAADSTFREREPCPLLRFPDGRILLSTNPALRPSGNTRPDGSRCWFCDMQLLEFHADDPAAPPEVITPAWDHAYHFTEHSYRGLAVDAAANELLIVKSQGYDTLPWTYRGAWGHWSRRGVYHFPLRGCYQRVALRNRAAYILAVSDIVEPNIAWRDFKKRVTHRDWDFDFRQVYFTWTPDIVTTDFSPTLTLASRDDTAGHTMVQDLWIGDDGDAHVLYSERNIMYTFFRDAYFRDTPLISSLQYCRIRHGQVIDRRIVCSAVEDITHRVIAENPLHSRSGPWRSAAPVGSAAFHADSDGTLYALYYLSAPDPSQSGLHITAILPDTDHRPVRIDLSEPLQSFVTASERTGTDPGCVIDIFGTAPSAPDASGPSPSTAVRYAQVTIG